MSEVDFNNSPGVKAFLQGTAHTTFPVIDGSKPLTEYLKLPASQYSTNVMRGYNKSIERLDETTFLFETEPLNILGREY